MYLVSVYFDDCTNKILQRLINKVAKKTGNDFMISHQVPPHMTISAIEARNVETLIPAFERLKGTLEKGTIQFVSIGQMLPYVFYTTPVLNAYLMDLSMQVYDSMKDMKETTVSKYYRPLSWLPHVTLGKTLTKEQMSLAFEVMQEQFQPFEATVAEIGLAKVNPHEDVRRFILK